MKNISLGAKLLSGRHGDCVQQRRRDEEEIARGNVIVLQLDLIGAAPGENARKFRFLVPVCADGRVQIVQRGDIFAVEKAVRRAGRVPFAPAPEGMSCSCAFS